MKWIFQKMPLQWLQGDFTIPLEFFIYPFKKLFIEILKLKSFL